MSGDELGPLYGTILRIILLLSFLCWVHYYLFDLFFNFGTAIKINKLIISVQCQNNPKNYWAFLILLSWINELRHGVSTHSTPDIHIPTLCVFLFHTEFWYSGIYRLQVKLKSFYAFGARLWNCLHPDRSKLEKWTFKENFMNYF